MIGPVSRFAFAAACLGLWAAGALSLVGLVTPIASDYLRGPLVPGGPAIATVSAPLFRLGALPDGLAFHPLVLIVGAPWRASGPACGRA